ncbi:hypothetical protein L7F22_006557 [Adiantum nelumboides]|nr:hypothetical protein [Adiantum nelumboides]
MYAVMNVTNRDISEIGAPKGKILELLPKPPLKLLKKIKEIIKEEEEMEAVVEEEEQDEVQEPAVGEPTLNDEEEERATLFVAIDNLRAREQYAVIQTTANHQGEKFKLLIDCGSTHSFLSSKCLRKLGLNQYPVKSLVVELANGKEVFSQHSAGKVDFELSGNSTSAYFRSLPGGIYDGLLGMDWLSENQAHIHCAQGNYPSKGVWENKY